MREAREEVAEFSRALTGPSSLVEASLTRVNQQGQARVDLNEEALKLLEVERDALATAWGLLKEELVEEGKDDSFLGPVPATFESVITTAVDAKTEMNSRKRLGGGKPRDYYNKFCQKAHQHKSVFSIFPNTDKYASIFCGSIKTLIKASVNYIQISEGLSKAFDEITELVDFAKRQVGIVPTRYTRVALAKLYKEIFLYLKDCTEWYSKTSKARALRSFNEDFYDCFKDRMECIKNIAITVHQEATIGGIQNLQVMLASGEDFEQQRRRQWENEMARWRVERQQMMQGNIQQQILQSFEQKILQILDRESGLRATGMLQDIWQSDQWQRARPGRLEGLQVDAQSIGEETEEPVVASSLQADLSRRDPTNQRYERETILESSKGLEKFIPGNSVDFLNTLPPANLAPAPVVTRLREWLTAHTSALLWVRGTKAGHYPSNLSALSGSLINGARASQVPILFHFCEHIKGSDIAEGLSVEEAGVIALVYSLIRQLILLLDSDVEVGFDLGSERFQKLESPVRNWEHAMALLSELLGLSPGVLFCVIDGFNELDYGRGHALCVDVLALMRRREQSSRQSGIVFKALFTTATYSQALDDGLDIDEVVLSRESKRRSGGQGGGQFFLFDEQT